MRDGVSGAGVNAVAHAAGVDKVLIYRYFGGGEGLLSALAAERAPLPDLLAASRRETTLHAALRAAILAELDAVRGSTLACRLAAWELSGADGFHSERILARRSAWTHVVTDLRARFAAPPFLDLDALADLLAGALRFAALSRASSGDHSGAGAAPPVPWERVEKMVDVIVRTLAAPRDA